MLQMWRWAGKDGYRSEGRTGRQCTPIRVAWDTKGGEGKIKGLLGGTTGVAAGMGDFVLEQ